MIKYFIYILKKDFLTLLATALILILGGLAMKFSTTMNRPELFLFISSLFFGMYIFFLIYRCITFLTADLFNNRRYFTYTLPLSKYSIQFGKLIYAFIYALVMVITLTLFTFFYFSNDYTTLEVNGIRTNNLILVIFATSATCLFAFSIANISLIISKIFTNSKKIGNFLAVIFIVLFIVLDTNSISDLLYYLNLKNETLAIILILSLHLIYSIILTFISSYLLDKKLEV